MSSDTLFLQPKATTKNSFVNSVEAEGNAQFFYNNNPSSSLTVTEVEALVKGGVALAIADADAILLSDAGFSDLFTNVIGEGEDGAFEGNSKVETKVVADFSLATGEKLSFDFFASLDLSASEIENPDAYYNKAKGKTAILVLDVSGERPRIIDYFGYKGDLITSKQIGKLKSASSRNVTINVSDETRDIDGNNGIDYLEGITFGSYERTFKRDTKIAIVKINESTVKFAGDNLINNLGGDVIYGKIFNDKLKGTNKDDKIYASLGDDKVNGGKGDDIIEGGIGNDQLEGDRGDDKLHGGFDNDDLIGGKGSDIMVGGEGSDTFIFYKGDIGKNDLDIIEDFEVGIDKVKFDGWGNINSEKLLGGMISGVQINNTSDGTLFSLNSGGELLFRNVSLDSLNASDFTFS